MITKVCINIKIKYFTLPGQQKKLEKEFWSKFADLWALKNKDDEFSKARSETLVDEMAGIDKSISYLKNSIDKMSIFD